MRGPNIGGLCLLGFLYRNIVVFFSYIGNIGDIGGSTHPALITLSGGLKVESIYISIWLISATTVDILMLLVHLQSCNIQQH